MSITPIDLSTLDARVAALRDHRLPPYTGRRTRDGFTHGADWKRHIDRHALPPVEVVFNILDHQVTVRWSAHHHGSEAPMVLLSVLIGVRDNFFSCAPLSAAHPKADALYNTINAIVREASSPSAGIRAAVLHIASLTDVEAASWAKKAAAMRALVTP